MHYILSVVVWCFIFVQVVIPAEYVSTNDTPPKLVSMPKIQVPKEAQATGLGGRVTVLVNIDRNGKVRRVMGMVGPGDVCSNFRRADVDAIREVARQNALKAVFTPATNNGRPIATTAGLNLDFPQRDESSFPKNEEAEPTKSGVLNGSAKSMPSPSYPDNAKKQRITGLVSVSVVIDEEGRVFSARAESGHELLTPSAVFAACRARFTPTQLDGKTFRVTGTITYNFTL